MTDLFGGETIPESRREYVKRRRRELFTAVGSYRNNPMLRFGKTPGMKCKDCANLCYVEYARRYYKCRLRKCTGGPKSDHRVGWDACSKFTKKNENIR